jgi:long-chain fatty acid transport protein
MKKVVLSGIAFLALLALAESALAGGFAIREQSAEGQGAAFAGVAAGTNGLSSMFWNPATMSQHGNQGYVTESIASIIAPYSHAKNGGVGSVPSAGISDSGNVGELALVPASYWTYGLSDALTIGAAMTSPAGLTTDAKDTWRGAVHGDKSKVATYNFNPNVAYQLNDMFSVGLGAQIELMTVKLTSRQPGTGLQLLAANADDIGLGFTAGLLFEPTDTTDIGVGFRSSIRHTLKGKARKIGVADPFGISAKYDAPEMITLGIRQQVNDQLTLLGGVEWTNWSRFKDLTITDNSTGAVVGTTAERWKDGWYYSVGAEYAASDVFTLRGGAAYEKSPVPDATRTPRAPDNDRVWLSLGAGYKLSDTMTANIAYSHVFVKNGRVDLPASASAPLALTADFKQHLDIVSASLTMDW